MPPGEDQRRPGAHAAAGRAALDVADVRRRAARLAGQVP
jgi:hypothetical protein